MKDPSREGLVQPFTFVVALRRFSGAAPPIPYSPSFEPYLSRFRIVYGGGMFGRLGLWSFRRIVSRNVFPERDEVSLINATFGNDFSPPGEFGKQSHEANILVSDEAIVRERLEQARTQSHAYAYWIQHEAPRDGGGGKGFPELGLDAETFGDPSGLAPAPYIRESRRIRALTTIVQQDVVAEGEKPAMSWARIFPDSVGWGAYPLDNHGGAISRARRFTRPHTIPFSALVPESADDVIAGSKNIGTTHLTNSAYRLHPVEIQVGQAAGAAAALAAANGLDFHGIAASAERMRELQQILLDHGAEIVPMRKPRPRSGPWRSVQTAVVAGWMSPGNPADLDFQAAEAVSWRTFCREVQPRARPRAGACAEGLAISDEPPTVKAAAEKLGIQVDEARDGPLTRGDLAKLLEAVLLEDVPLSRGRAALEFLASGVLANATPSTLQLPPDVPATSPYAGAVLALVAAGAARPDEPFEPFRDLRWADVDAWIGGPGRLAEERETMIHPNRTLTEGVLSAVLSRRARAPGIPAQSPSPEP